MSTNAVAFLLLNQYREGATVSQLIEAIEILKSDFILAGKDIGFSGEPIDVIHYAVSNPVLIYNL